ncbi:MAG: hypothetical protein LBH07_03665 [Treponema sp.]|jgi:hypothetical protein|nr:hypothetical protein [Treponema sp.]
MTVFCFLWIPLFYLFWRSLYDAHPQEGGTWALLLGTVVAFIRFFLGSFVYAEGFGYARWISACIDVVALNAVIPFIVCIIFSLFRIISFKANFTNYALLWLIPVAAVSGVGWSSQNNPILLMGVPVLWTALAVGIGFFIRIVQKGWSWAMIPSILGAFALPLLAATAYWALFAQHSLLGLSLGGLCLVPMTASIVLSFFEKRNGDSRNGNSFV